LNYHFEILPPSPIFRPYIEYYKNVVTDAEGTFKCVPNNSEELYFNFKKIHLYSNNHYSLDDPHIYFVGLHQYEQEAYATIDGSISGGFVIVFKPNGIQNLFRLSNDEIFGYAIEGEYIFRSMSEKLWHELKEITDIAKKKAKVESFLLRFVNPDFDPSNFVNQILQLIKQKRGLLSTGEISKRFNISLRTLERKFIDGVGMSPKEYLQITRLNHALNLLQGKNGFSLTRVSYLSGYYDQSHFIRDIKKICGFPPGTLKKENQHLEKCDNRNFLKLS
jgi:AraC-like DNA-binding protein